MRRRAGPARLAVLVAIVAVCVEICVSANLLTWIGIPYISDGGTLLFKLHPGTDLLLLACVMAAAAQPAWLARLDGLLWLYVVALAGCIVSTAMLTGHDNLVVLLDTFLPAGLLAAMLADAPPCRLAFLRRAMQILLAVGAMLALAEVACQATLIPLIIDDDAYHPRNGDFRPAALFDHPLTGALMMMIGLRLTPRHDAARMAYQMLMWAALVAFGGRTAIAVSLAATGATGTLHLLQLIVRRNRRAGLQVGLTACGLLACALLLAAALEAGLGDRLAGHLYWDASAQARLAQWRILGDMNGGQILFGMDRTLLLANIHALRLATGVGVIENFWLLMFASLGAGGFALFLLAMGALCLWCWRRSGAQGRALLMATLLVASTSNSLGRKSVVLVCLVAAIACLPDAPARRPASGFRRMLAQPA